MASSQIAQLTDYSVDMDAENVMDVRTEKLDPIVSSAYRYTFRLDTAAYLDKNTMLLFKVKAKTGEAANNIRLNCFNGGLGAIENVELRIGDFQVQRINNVNQWSTLNHLYSSSPEVQNKKFSHYLQNGIQYRVLTEDEANAGQDADLTGVITTDPVASGINYGASGDRAGAAVNNHKVEEDADNNQLIGIPLGMLLPMLNTRDLPLFLFTAYKIHLTIEFNPSSSQFANKIGAPSANLACADGDILFSDVNLLVDYLVFPSRVQESVREKTQSAGGYVMDFINVENIQKTLPAATANTQQAQEFRINVINQEVHYIQMLKQFTTYADNNNKVTLGQRADSVSVEEYQVNVNGVDFFNFGFVFNPVEMYNNVSYVLGRDLQVPAPYYVADTNTEASMISPPAQGLLGKYKPMALDLRNGEPVIRGGGRIINEYPIRWIYNRTPHAQVNSQIQNTPQIGQNEVSGCNIQFFVGVSRVVKVMALPSGGMNVLVSDL
tara:strand:+ start:1147 stop:2628 length:1482 start_codon:yes stop_codon:yes gene_type:complete